MKYIILLIVIFNVYFYLDIVLNFTLTSRLPKLFKKINFIPFIEKLIVYINSFLEKLSPKKFFTFLKKIFKKR